MRQIHVLIGDEDANARLDLKTLLADLGHVAVGETDTGPKTVIQARSLRPDLVIVDSQIPSLSGLDVAQVLSDELIAPTILVSKSVSFADVDRLDRSGVMGLLIHPLRGADLGAMVEIARARWRRISDLTAEVQSLNERMEARKLVGRAKAILMEKFGLQERDAFRRIQVQSATLNKPVHEIARAIITAHDISSP